MSHTVADASPRMWNDAVIAESDDVTVVDGYTYFPTAAVNHEFLRPSSHRSVCAWKGTASYYDVVVDDRVNPEAAWYYPTPNGLAARRVAGRIGFWHGVRVVSDDANERKPGLLTRVANRLH